MFYFFKASSILYSNEIIYQYSNKYLDFKKLSPFSSDATRLSTFKMFYLKYDDLFALHQKDIEFIWFLDIFIYFIIST